MILGIIARKQQKSTGDDESTLALKLVGSKVIRSPKHRLPVAHKNGPWSNKNFSKKKKNEKTVFMFAGEIPKDFLAALGGGGAAAKPVQPTERVVEKVVHVHGNEQQIQEQLNEERTRIKQVQVITRVLHKTNGS